MNGQRGFTLPEVLVALLIFALIASASVYALRLGVNARDQLEASDAALKELQIARTLIKEDLAQVVQRPVRDEFGIQVPAAFYGGEVEFLRRPDENEELLLSFVRSGWLNADARAPRSALQYVEYVFRDGALIRRARVYLDDASRSEHLERVLFSDVKTAEVQFLIGEVRRELEWADAWPVSNSVAPPPPAIALTLERGTGETLRQYFWIGAMGTG